MAFKEFPGCCGAQVIYNLENDFIVDDLGEFSPEKFLDALNKKGRSEGDLYSAYFFIDINEDESVGSKLADFLSKKGWGQVYKIPFYNAGTSNNLNAFMWEVDEDTREALEDYFEQGGSTPVVEPKPMTTRRTSSK